MADDPMTITVTKTENVAPGLSVIYGTMVGPADYDDSGGAACDLSSYLTTMKGGVKFTGVDTQADALVVPMYLNSATTASTGYVTFTWDTANDGNAENARAFSNVTDTTNLSGYTWYFEAWGTPPTRT